MTTVPTNTNDTAAPHPGGAIVVIVVGRNEGQRLNACLDSLRAVTDRIIYVDSGSRDGSLELARSKSVHAFSLPGPRFTAAMGRQRGLVEARTLFPDARYVQFIDGDCTIDPAWLGRAAHYLDQHPRVAGVFGRVREANTAGSIYSRFVDMEWNLKPGPVNLHGGIAMDRLAAIDEVGGWADDLIAGEEPDLAFRMRDKGWEIHAVDQPMCTHDIAIHRLRPYLRRIVRTGHAYAEVGFKHRRGIGRYFWYKRTASIVAYGILFPLIIIALAILWWPAALAFSLLIYAKVALGFWRAARAKDADVRTAASYAGVNVLGKFAAAWGVVRFAFLKLTGQRARIIEYKPTPATNGGA